MRRATRITVFATMLITGSAHADVPMPGVPWPCEGKQVGDPCTIHKGWGDLHGVCLQQGSLNSPHCEYPIPPGVEPRSSGCGGCSLSASDLGAGGFAFALAAIALALLRRRR